MPPHVHPDSADRLEGEHSRYAPSVSELAAPRAFPVVMTLRAPMADGVGAISTMPLQETAEAAHAHRRVVNKQLSRNGTRSGRHSP
jgi:hypothetical protein